MSRSLVNYIVYDKTGDPRATTRARYAPKFCAYLANLGFQSLGVLVALPKSREQYANILRPRMSEPDADLMIKITTNGEAEEITTAPDGQAFGLVEHSVSGPVICFETLLENGMLVETTQRPRRPPRAAGYGRQDSSAPDWLMHLIAQPPIWPRRNAPAAGFFVELVETTDAGVLYEHHRARVAQYSTRYHTAPLQHNNLDLYKAICIRNAQVIDHFNRVQRVLEMMLVVAFLAIVIVAILQERHMLVMGDSLALAVIFIAVVVLFMFAFPISGVISPLIPAQVSPVVRLLEIQREEWGPFDYDYDPSIDGR